MPFLDRFNATLRPGIFKIHAGNAAAMCQRRIEINLVGFCAFECYSLNLQEYSSGVVSVALMRFIRSCWSITILLYTSF